MPQLEHSMFYDVFFGQAEHEDHNQQADLQLQKVLRFSPSLKTSIKSSRLVVFDFETTGLDSEIDQIIEIGALLVEGGKPVQEFSTLVKPTVELEDTITKITGITKSMLADKPAIEDVLPEFLRFFDGSILVAHNAEFDMGFLRKASALQGYQIDWPCFCTLKLARQLLPDLESKNLDTLAEHYNLSFEARHRSIGDCKVTSSVLHALLREEGEHLKSWQDFEPFYVK